MGNLVEGNMDSTTTETIRTYARAAQQGEKDLLRTLATIPAPSGHEQERASLVASWLREEGAREVEIDHASNVICHLAPRGATPDLRPLVVFAAHMDVVFPDVDALPVREEGGRMYAPGVGDDTANLAGLLMATKLLLQDEAALERATKGHDLLIVANSCEEGLGNLAGTRALFERYAERIERFYSFDLYLPQCISEAVGSERYEVEARCQGGHSYHDFGRPNAIVELSGLVQELYETMPREGSDGTPITINAGTIEGGTSVNSIASRARLRFEFRSTSALALKEARSHFAGVVSRRGAALSHADDAPEAGLRVSTLGIRPGTGDVDQEELGRMSEATERIIREVTGEEPDPSPASTDANIPLSLGIPANTVGTVRGALLHTRDEWVDLASLEDGLRVILGLMLQ